jgi:polar amino acid transport system substrate-binding protein
MKKNHVRQVVFSLMQLWLISLNASASPVARITLHYYERPPFHYTDDKGQPEGLILKKTIEIFDKAGISYSWEQTPANRILALIKSHSGNDCSPGWYKNEERESYAIFSDAIYHDKPLIGLTRIDFKVRDGITAKELFSMSNVRLLLKQNFSQGGLYG